MYIPNSYKYIYVFLSLTVCSNSGTLGVFFKWDEFVQVATKCPVMMIIPVVRNRDQHLRRILRHLPLPAIANAHVNCTEC